MAAPSVTRGATRRALCPACIEAGLEAEWAPSGRCDPREEDHAFEEGLGAVPRPLCEDTGDEPDLDQADFFGIDGFLF